MANVQIAIPNQGWIHKGLLRTVVGILNANREHGHNINITTPSGKPVDNNRNMTIKSFLDSPAKFDFLFFIDADNPPMEGTDPLAVIADDLDVVFFPTPMWVPDEAKKGNNPIAWNSFDVSADDPQTWTETAHSFDLKEVAAGGSGAMIVARRVLEAVKPAFMREWDEDGIVRRGSDLLFCDRARKAGFRVWCDYRVPCHHYKERDMAEVAKSYAAVDSRDPTDLQPTEG